MPNTDPENVSADQIKKVQQITLGKYSGENFLKPKKMYLFHHNEPHSKFLVIGS